jgi:Fe-S-cluster containining protein
MRGACVECGEEEKLCESCEACRDCCDCAEGDLIEDDDDETELRAGRTSDAHPHVR